jgi:hypothetical protein
MHARVSEEGVWPRGVIIYGEAEIKPATDEEGVYY